MRQAENSLLLDTCAVVWAVNDDDMSSNAVAAIDAAGEAGRTVFISPITAWEIGLLIARGRLVVSSRAQQWFGKVSALPGVTMADMPPEVLIASSFLPGTPPRDPADRIIIATAREFGFQIVTRDRIILDYANEGHVQALVC